MEHNKLKRIRLIYPGILIIIQIYCYLYFQGYIYLLELKLIPFSIVELSLGALYYILSIRDLIWKPTVNSINNMIIHDLILIAQLNPSIDLNDTQKTNLMGLFFHIIDSDKSLSMKANNVRENGGIFTCTIDTFILSIFYLIILLIFGAKPISYILFLLIIIVIILTIPSYFILLIKHKQLAKKQLEVISLFYKEDCKKRVREIIQHHD